MDEETIANFCAVTNSEPKHAERYLAFSGGDLDTAVMMFFETGGQLPDDNAMSNTTNSSVSASRPGSAVEPIDLEDEDDEAMARRLAQEWGGQNEEVRAPIAPTRQVLQDDMSPFDSFSMPPAFVNRFGPLGAGGGAAYNGRGAPRGVFNQAAPSVWDGENEEAFLSEATGGASAQSSKSSRLARLFQPPFDIMSHVDFDTARSEARTNSRWIMINLQDNSDFASQTLNRDLWKDKTVKAMVQENFIFLQYTKESDDGAQYIQFYPFEKYPHIAIVDPRTGERVKTWSESMQALEFLSEVSEFLDRFSLDEDRQNPVQKKARPAPKTIDKMSEEDQLNAAIMASVGGTMEDSNGYDDEDDSMVGDAADNDETSAAAPVVRDTPFSRIPAVLADEPPAGPETTRIQLRLATGRTVRRFLLADPVRRVFEYVKAGVPEAQDKVFKLVFNRTNLIDKLDVTIAEAGLKNASLVVEFDD